MGGSFRKLRRMSIAKDMSTNISKVRSFSVMSEKTRLKKVKASNTWKYLRKWGSKEGVNRKRVDEEAPKLDASVVGADDVPSVR